MKRTFMALLATVFVFASSYAFAGIQTGAIPVSVNVLTACTINTGAVAFPNYASNSGIASMTSTSIGVICGTGVPYTVTSNTGSYSVGYFPRQMFNGLFNYLQYNLYTDAAYTTVFGDGTAGTFSISGFGTDTLNNYTIYAQIPFGQLVPAGGYQDTVTATVSW